MEENLDGLLFIGHKDIAPKNLPLVGLVKVSPLSRPFICLGAGNWRSSRLQAGRSSGTSVYHGKWPLMFSHDSI